MKYDTSGSSTSIKSRFCCARSSEAAMIVGIATVFKSSTTASACLSKKKKKTTIYRKTLICKDNNSYFKITVFDKQITIIIIVNYRKNSRYKK